MTRSAPFVIMLLLSFHLVLSVGRTIDHRGWPEALPFLALTFAAALALSLAIEWALRRRP